MSAQKPGDDWKQNASGIVVPPGAHAPDVVKAEFAVKVRGFAPEPKFVWDGVSATQVVITTNLRPIERLRRAK